MTNVTRVYDAKLDLNFIKEKIVFSSKLQPDGNQITFEATASSFVKKDQCEDNLLITSMNGTTFPRPFYDNTPVELEEYLPIDFIELVRTCNFQYPLIPNGDFTLLLFNQTNEPLIVEKLVFLPNKCIILILIIVKM